MELQGFALIATGNAPILARFGTAAAYPREANLIRVGLPNGGERPFGRHLEDWFRLFDHPG